jgi:RecJ-like exonuclease
MARTDSDPRPEESSVRRLFRRLVASDSELDAEDLQEASARIGATPVDECARGGRVTVSGRLTSVVYTPRTNLPTLEAELFDGTGTVTLVWLGRRRIPGIEPGRSLSAEGRLAVRDDRKVIYNPRYTLEPNAS